MSYRQSLELFIDWIFFLEGFSGLKIRKLEKNGLTSFGFSQARGDRCECSSVWQHFFPLRRQIPEVLQDRSDGSLGASTSFDSTIFTS